MSAEIPASGTQAFGYLVRLVGRGALVRLAGLMALASATEGIGLLLLVPLTSVVAGSGLPGAGRDWSAALAAFPLWVLLGGFVVLVAARAAIMYHVRGARTALGLTLTRRLRRDVQQALMGADWRWLSNERSGDHAAVLVGQSERLGQLVDEAVELVTVSITILVLTAMAFWLSWQLTAVTIMLTGALVVAAVVVRREQEPLGETYSHAYLRLQRHVAEGLAHLRAARIAGAERAIARDFDDTTATLQRSEWDYARATQRANLTLQVISAAILAAIVYIGLRVFAVSLSLFVPVLAIFMRIAPLAGNLQQGWRAWRFCQPELTMLLETLRGARRAAEPLPGDGPAPNLTRAIELRGISLRFEGRAERVFDRFDLVIPAGSVVAVTGPSGSGKSTLADLLSGLVAPDDGVIAVDGVPLVGSTRIGWRRQVAYVEQVPFLIDDTIAANLTWGLDRVPPRAIEDALRRASAGFVFALPDGADTLVGETGRELSGGERQRISLARALLRQPQLLILDEVTAALDARNEAAIADTIAAMRGTATFVILGHRPALHALADQVISLGDR